MKDDLANCGCDIEDALYWHFAEDPASAALARVENVERDDGPHMVCHVGTRVPASWRLDPEDVPTAPQVIANVLDEICGGARAAALPPRVLN